MSDKYFKAILQAIPPSHSAGRKMTVYGVALTGQTVRDQAKHVGQLRGLGASKVVSAHVYKDGDSWYRAQHGSQKKPATKRRKRAK